MGRNSFFAAFALGLALATPSLVGMVVVNAFLDYALLVHSPLAVADALRYIVIHAMVLNTISLVFLLAYRLLSRRGHAAAPYVLLLVNELLDIVFLEINFVLVYAAVLLALAGEIGWFAAAALSAVFGLRLWDRVNRARVRQTVRVLAPLLSATSR